MRDEIFAFEEKERKINLKRHDMLDWILFYTIL